ncbi:hypothetical protein GLAREA_12368 [Glarea lozoyensis ATCC 20868]|nr:uncharacterized protein GLAREA_12368 [Glarea lozoyensis ATCC 20868]EPE31612.1 hypothetical protein GLAREA_12368 [Glarea lozoyensis ATCC 20868]
MFARSAAAVLFLSTFAAAANYTLANPGAISDTLKAQWCAAELSTCPILCGTSLPNEDNNCDATTLNYTCTCTNGTGPGLIYYRQTLPTFICEQIYTDCIVAGANNAAAQRTCDQNRATNCGTLDPANYTAPVSSSSSSMSATATPTSGGASSATAVSTSSSAGAAPTMAIGAQYGSGVLVAGAAAAFGLLL